WRSSGVSGARRPGSTLPSGRSVSSSTSSPHDEWLPQPITPRLRAKPSRDARDRLRLVDNPAGVPFGQAMLGLNALETPPPPFGAYKLPAATQSHIYDIVTALGQPPPL